MNEINNEISVRFCHCGRMAIREIDSVFYCFKHNRPPKTREIIGRYSGKSQTPYGGYEER
jgi:hypothetical protein